MSKEPDEEKFSDDPEENLKMENEFMKLKMKAQFGDAFLMQSDGALPPEIEHQFLKQVMAFEENFQKAEFITLGEKIGLTEPKSSEDMSEAEISEALTGIENIMEEHSIFLDRIDGPYPDKVIYDFITKELLARDVDKNSVVTNMMQFDLPENEKGISEENDGEEYNTESEEENYLSGEEEDDFELPPGEAIPGFQNGLHFIYEEFHPNNEKEIEKNTVAFMEHWKERSFNEYSRELAYHMIYPPAEQMSREELYKKLFQFFDSFSAFENFKFIIGQIHFEEQVEDMMLGHSEGAVFYDALMENGEKIHYEGTFKLYMQRQDMYWSIMYFVMPGFEWQGK